MLWPTAQEEPPRRSVERLTSQPSRSRALVIDDLEMIRESLSRWLRASLRFECDAVATVAAARDALSRTTYDLILIEPCIGPEAWRLVDSLSADPPDAGPKVIVLTARIARDMVECGVAAGALGVVAKDEPFPSLAGMIHAVLRGERVISPVMRSTLTARGVAARPEGGPISGIQS